MRVLVTYFAPFGTDTLNASALAVKLLPEEIRGARLWKIELPVAFSGAEKALKTAITAYSPVLVLCTGQAEGTAEMHLERVAVNLRDARMPDNEGNAPDEMPILPDGPAAYFATLPVKHLAELLRDQGIPAAVSNSAGTYVCNDVMYTLLHTLSAAPGTAMGGSPGTRAGGSAVRQRSLYGTGDGGRRAYDHHSRPDLTAKQPLCLPCTQGVNNFLTFYASVI